MRMRRIKHVLDRNAKNCQYYATVTFEYFRKRKGFPNKSVNSVKTSAFGASFIIWLIFLQVINFEIFILDIVVPFEKYFCQERFPIEKFSPA